MAIFLWTLLTMRTVLLPMLDDQMKRFGSLERHTRWEEKVYVLNLKAIFFWWTLQLTGVVSLFWQVHCNWFQVSQNYSGIQNLLSHLSFWETGAEFIFFTYRLPGPSPFWCILCSPRFLLPRMTLSRHSKWGLRNAFTNLSLSFVCDSLGKISLSRRKSSLKA